MNKFKNHINLFLGTALTMIICLPMANVLAVPKHTSDSQQQQAVQKFVEKAVSYLKTHGRYQAIMTFNNPHGEFRTNHRYIFAIVCGSKHHDGFNLATNPDFENEHAFTDTRTSYPATAKVVETASVNGSWYTYKFDNPRTHQPATKHSYVIRVPKYQLCIGSGYYDQ
ncbi:MAG: cache domain-containing protein [Pseudomonadota bacterium]